MVGRGTPCAPVFGLWNDGAQRTDAPYQSSQHNSHSPATPRSRPSARCALNLSRSIVSGQCSSAAGPFPTAQASLGENR
jgi:hypothetical protein